MTQLKANSNLSSLFNGFNTISLDGLNAKAEMLTRIDNKYVAGRDTLAKVLPMLVTDFDILEIKDCRAFTYETRYFDDNDSSTYNDHHKRRRKRFKVRVRRYAEADLSFLEVKLRGKRGMTIKHRMPYESAATDVLSDEAIGFAGKTYGDHYGLPFNYELRPSLDMRYKRVTLVAKAGGERMTIDSELEFWSGDQLVNVSPELCIIETKSKLGRGIADVSFREVHKRPAKHCSKYCIGMAATGGVEKWNRFLPTMRKMDLVANTTVSRFDCQSVVNEPIAATNVVSMAPVRPMRKSTLFGGMLSPLLKAS